MVLLMTLIKLFLNKLVLIYFDVRIIIIIKRIFIINRIGVIEKSNFLLFLLSSDISFDKASGVEKEAKLINNMNVGSINIYILIPLVPISLDIFILITRLSIFVIKLPINNIKVDFKKFFFIVNFMFFIKKYIII